MIRLIAFDLDGTLIDSRRDIADSINKLLGSYGAVPLPFDDVLAMVGEGALLLIGRALKAARLDVSLREAHGRFLGIYDRRLVDHTRLYDGGLEALQTLAGGSSPGAGVALAVLTNKPDAPAVRILEHLGIADRFIAVVGGDGPLPRKPDPQALLALCAQAGVAPDETLMVGDSWVDVHTARNAATHACFVTYGFGAPPPEGLLPGELQVDRASDLVAAVAGLNAVTATA
jgi:phosphoglycolate phosphatase